MAKAYITEFGTAGGLGLAVKGPEITSQTLAIGTVVSSAKFGDNTKVVRVHVDAICSIAFGPNPVATTSNARMAANQTEYFGVRPGDKISVISNT